MGFYQEEHLEYGQNLFGKFVFLELHICLIFILKSIPILVGGLVPLPDSLRSTLTDPLRETPYLWVFMLSSGTIKATFSIVLQVV